MRARTLLVLTALVSSILGAVVVYLVLTVPNDLQSGSLLKQARADIAAGKTAEAHDTLSRIVQQYPRTDAAAAAMVALLKLEEQRRERMQAEIGQLRSSHEQHTKAIGELQKSVQTLGKAPAPLPAPATVTQPAAAKTTTAKKPTTKKRTPTRRRKR